MKSPHQSSSDLAIWLVAAVVVVALLWTAFGPSNRPKIIIKEHYKWIEVPGEIPDPIEVPVYYPVEKVIERIVYVVKRVPQHCESVADALNKYEQLK